MTRRTGSRGPDAGGMTRAFVSLDAPIPSVVVVCAVDSPELMKAQALSQSLGCPLLACAERGFDWVLLMTEAGLELRSGSAATRPGLKVSFLRGKGSVRRRAAEGKSQPLAKAVGARGAAPRVVDATAGLARDAFQLAGMGCRVRAIERSPILAALVQDGIARGREAGDAKTRAALERLTFIMGDSRSHLRGLAGDDIPDAVYLDPMHPPRTKSAAVKKEMVLCRALVGDDADADELLQTALAVGCRRVVVKRPLRAPPLLSEPTMIYRGTRVRYDVYVPGSARYSG